MKQEKTILASNGAQNAIKITRNNIDEGKISSMEVRDAWRDMRQRAKVAWNKADIKTAQKLEARTLILEEVVMGRDRK